MSKTIISKGIDVSRWQGAIDWRKVKAAGVDFAFIRAGYCGYAGGIVKDAMFDTNMKGAAAAGVNIGVYLYSYALTVDAAKTAATQLLKVLNSYNNINYPVVFDIEDAVNIAMSKADNTAITKAFLSTIEAAGYFPMLYTYKSFAESSLNMAQLTEFDLWLAHITNQTNYTGPYTVWQHSWTGKVDGISGEVDLNQCYVDYPTIIKEGGYNGFESSVTEPDTKPEMPDIDENEKEVPPETGHTVYTVVKNDNLTRISQKFGVPLRDVIQANHTVKNTTTGKTRVLDNPNLIYVGDLIHIPA